ncbi:MAG: acylphosphatase [Pirellulaceae bacterium]|nr:acylphosphatase [Pirellulaceae bacterium]
MKSLARREVFYAGRVQGVGFRYNARRIAAEFAVTGFVCNLPDRRVRLVVEGEAAEVERFLARVRDSMADNIRSESALDHPATGEFASFDITS